MITKAETVYRDKFIVFVGVRGAKCAESEVVVAASDSELYGRYDATLL